MEAPHFAAGPWFTVIRSGDDWQTLDTIWLSDGRTNEKAEVQIRLELGEIKHVTQ
ncbi:MAG: hypothetical protein IID36_11925 [Planctomycetes bacterium]|nr:hypothetical protein [Planctomycetota bacterium]